MRRIAYAAWALLVISLVIVIALSPGTAHSVMLYVLAAAAVAASAASVLAALRGRAASRLALVGSILAALGALGVVIALFLLSQPGAQEGDIGGSGLFVLAVILVLVATPLANLPGRTVRA